MGEDIKRPYGFFIIRAYDKEGASVPEVVINPLQVKTVGWSYHHSHDRKAIICMNDHVVFHVWRTSQEDIAEMIDIAMRERLALCTPPDL